MDELLNALRAAAETTRLRLLAICSEGEVAVGEMTRILEQSQPRVSRHLRLLCEAGLLERHKEGTWVFYRIADEGEDGKAALARRIIKMIPDTDPQRATDRKALETIKRERAAIADAYFRANAGQWDRLRALHVDAREVEHLLTELLPAGAADDLLDVGTGTGRMLELFGPSIRRGTGIDLSREMIAVARAKLDTAGLANCQVRHGDMYRLPVADASFDAATLHLVLHYADDPGAVIAEAARALRPGGRMLIADFAPHTLEELRSEHAHRRLGFGDREVMGWCASAGLVPETPRHLAGQPLTVVIWAADKPDQASPGAGTRFAGDGAPRQEAARS